jgi:hypothetical protein
MNSPEKAHELYKKMIGMKGHFTIVFHNYTKYPGCTLEGGKYHWDEETRTGNAELNTVNGKLSFDFSQVKKIS